MGYLIKYVVLVCCVMFCTQWCNLLLCLDLFLILCFLLVLLLCSQFNSAVVALLWLDFSSFDIVMTRVGVLFYVIFLYTEIIIRKL